MFPKYIILQAVYYELRFSFSYRDVEELLKNRGITVDHATIQTWVFKFTPLIDQNVRKRKIPAGSRWRLDETYFKVNGKWCYLYRAVKEGKTIDFLLTHRRQKRAAHRFLTKAIAQNGIPDLINIDKSGSNKEAIRVYNRRNYTKIKYRQCKYHNNIIEKDHRLSVEN